MKKFLKQTLALISASVLCCTMFATTASAKSSSGSLDGIRWEVNTQTGTLTFSGSGKLPDLSDNSFGWAYDESIRNVKFGEGITSLFSISQDVRNYFPSLEMASGTLPGGFSWGYDNRSKTLTYKGRGEFSLDYCNRMHVFCDKIVISDGITCLNRNSGNVYFAQPYSFEIGKDCRDISFWSYQVLKSYKVDPKNPYLTTYNDLLYSKDYETLVGCPRSASSPQLHSKLKTIGQNALSGVLDTTIVIPKGTTTMEYQNFSEFTGTLVIPDTLTFIDWNTKFNPNANVILSSKNTEAAAFLRSRNCEPNVNDDLYKRYYSGSRPNLSGDRTPGGGWQNVGSDYFYYENGKKLIGLHYIDGKAYFFDQNGARLHDTWKYADGNWYYLNSYGAGAVKCWLKKDGKWYFVNDEGKVLYNQWIQFYDNWYRVDGNGVRMTGLNYIDGKAYYFDQNGVRLHDKWHYANGNWYYLNSYGAGAVKCWLQSGNKWYFMQADGTMAKSKWINWYNKWYYVGSDGAMYKNRYTPDGCWVNGSGVWVK